MSRKFLSSYTKEFRCIVAGKDYFHALCTYCDQQIDLSSIGKPSITKHVGTDKHKKNAKIASENQALTQFLKPKRSSEDDKIAAAEGSWSYHTAKHFSQRIALQAKDCFKRCLRTQTWPKNLLQEIQGSEKYMLWLY